MQPFDGYSVSSVPEWRRLTVRGAGAGGSTQSRIPGHKKQGEGSPHFQQLTSNPTYPGCGSGRPNLARSSVVRARHFASSKSMARIVEVIVPASVSRRL